MKNIGQIIETIDILGAAVFKITNEWDHDEETDNALKHMLGLLTWLDMELSQYDDRE